jgi:mRNA interferase RelE/StbE
MVEYAIRFKRSARKELENLPAAIVRRIIPKIEALLHDPFPRDSKKLHGEADRWRIRIGDYRVVYTVLKVEHVIEIIIIRPRGRAYQ